jgi:hypothetical protein
MSYNGPPPTSSGKDKVRKLCLTTGHHGPVVARIRSKNMPYNGPPPTSSGKDKVGQLFLTTGHHRPVVARIRSEKYVLQRATTIQ